MKWRYLYVNSCSPDGATNLSRLCNALCSVCWPLSLN